MLAKCIHMHCWIQGCKIQSRNKNVQEQEHRWGLQNVFSAFFFFFFFFLDKVRTFARHHRHVQVLNMFPVMFSYVTTLRWKFRAAWSWRYVRENHDQFTMITPNAERAWSLGLATGTILHISFVLGLFACWSVCQTGAEDGAGEWRVLLRRWDNWVLSVHGQLWFQAVK